MKEFVVTFTTSKQISPDDWAVFNPSMKVTETTTVKEIADFFYKNVKNEDVEVKLIELQQSVSSSKKETYYDANGSEIKNAYFVDSEGNPIPFEFTEAAKNGYKSASEYVAAYKK